MTRPTPRPVHEQPTNNAGHGEVFTREWVVEFMLDLVDYRPDRDLSILRLVEPACGQGAFLSTVAVRLGEACRKYDRPLSDAHQAVRAYDVELRNVDAARDRVIDTLAREGWPLDEADQLARMWVRHGDYLLGADRHEPPADFVVGNPPYVRLEDLPTELMDIYRAACPTMRGRADLYVGFYEQALRSLAPSGTLAFICADRWMRNQYGQDLRRMVGADYSVDVVVTMHDVDAFDERVSAYPAITVIRRDQQASAVVVQTNRQFDQVAGRELLNWIEVDDSTDMQTSDFSASRLPHWFPANDLWPCASPARLSLIERLTDRFIPLGDPRSGARVGIGVATGADRVFITKDSDLVEPRRLLPLSMVRDTSSGTLRWSGNYLVNPWDDDGQLVDLDQHPKLKRYFLRHQQVLAMRHVGRRQPHRWYRTIDKVDARLTSQPKLLFPDMKLTSEPVLDPGGFYPHHNLYFVTSDQWDLRALGGLLLSEVAEAFIDAYAVKMRGGTLRFQAQYLRRIPVPSPKSINSADLKALINAFELRDKAAATAAAERVYGIVLPR